MQSPLPVSHLAQPTAQMLHPHSADPLLGFSTCLPSSRLPLCRRWQAAAKPFVEDRAMRDRKRATDKFVTLNVQQISATLEQVRRCGTAHERAVLAATPQLRRGLLAAPALQMLLSGFRVLLHGPWLHLMAHGVRRRCGPRRRRWRRLWRASRRGRSAPTPC